MSVGKNPRCPPTRTTPSPTVISSPSRLPPRTTSSPKATSSLRCPPVKKQLGVQKLPLVQDVGRKEYFRVRQLRPVQGHVDDCLIGLVSHWLSALLPSCLNALCLLEDGRFHFDLPKNVSREKQGKFQNGNCKEAF